MTRTASRAATAKTVPAIDLDYVVDTLRQLLEIRSPAGYTDQIVRWTAEELERIGLTCELTRRGAMRVRIEGKQHEHHRSVVAHLDTLGAMVKQLKDNGRIEVVPIGTWSARFAEGARVTVMTDRKLYRGTILPLKASGHTFGDAVDIQETGWQHVELRVDEVVRSRQDLEALGISVGDFVSIDPQPEFTESGFINARHLDDKAGSAVLLGLAKALVDSGRKPPIDTQLIFTVSEEVGSGASHTLHGDVAEMVTIDNGTSAPGQNSSEFGVTIAMMDRAGPFDWHLTRLLIELCEQHAIPYQRDVFLHYRSDSASAVDAGNDVRTALACFGVDASHGWERTHRDSLRALGTLILRYVLHQPVLRRDRQQLAPLEEGFPEKQPTGDGAPPD